MGKDVEYDSYLRRIASRPIAVQPWTVYQIGEGLRNGGLAWCSGLLALRAGGYVADLVAVLGIAAARGPIAGERAAVEFFFASRDATALDVIDPFSLEAHMEENWGLTSILGRDDARKRCIAVRDDMGRRLGRAATDWHDRRRTPSLLLPVMRKPFLAAYGAARAAEDPGQAEALAALVLSQLVSNVELPVWFRTTQIMDNLAWSLGREQK